MKKIILMTCVLSFAAMPSLYAQSKKQIIANQQQKIEQQQQQIDSLNRANGYLQGTLDQLSNQFNRLDSVNTKLTFQNQEFQHRIDSLNSVSANLRQELKTKEQENERLREEKAKQQKAAAAQKQAREKAKQAQEKAKQDDLEAYRALCAGSEKKLKDLFNKDTYKIDRFPQTKTALLDTYEEKCNAGEVSSLDQVKWSFQKNAGPIGHSRAMAEYENWRHQYTFILQCPNGRSFTAYQFCFLTVYMNTQNNFKRVFSSYTPCSESGENLNITRQ